MRNKLNLLPALFLALLLTAQGLVAQQPAPAPAPVAIKIEASSFDPFVGQYENTANLPGTILSFYREGDKFYLRVTNQEKIEVTPSAAN